MGSPTGQEGKMTGPGLFVGECQVICHQARFSQQLLCRLFRWVRFTILFTSMFFSLRFLFFFLYIYTFIVIVIVSVSPSG